MSLVQWITTIVTVASIIAAIVLPLAIATWPSDLDNRFGILFWVFFVLGVMAILKHVSNIQKLMNGSEHRLFDKKVLNNIKEES